MPTIVSKLRRYDWLPLSQMQDIGGCRAIMPSSNDAFGLATAFANSRIRHEPSDYDNYIACPKASGYRGLHLVYKYSSDRNPRWQGLKTEIQIRSQLQHQWATAVETVGTFTGHELKSSLGDRRWLRFFALMSSVIARREKSPIVPNTPPVLPELRTEVIDLYGELQVAQQLEMYEAVTRGLQGLRQIRNNWVVLELDLAEHEVRGRLFDERDVQKAGSWYSKKELEIRENAKMEVVMVSVKSVNQLRRAYPNFFADLTQFRELVKETID